MYRRSRLHEYLALEKPLEFSNMAHHDAPCSMLFAYEASRGTAKPASSDLLYNINRDTLHTIGHPSPWTITLKAADCRNFAPDIQNRHYVWRSDFSRERTQKSTGSHKMEKNYLIEVTCNNSVVVLSVASFTELTKISTICSIQTQVMQWPTTRLGIQY